MRGDLIRNLGFECFATTQNCYNLSNYKQEREILPYCQKEKIGINPLSPFGAAFLTTL
ncbi:hypothetical protein [Haladaptatus halobius]|uniref:hypothetical protein n=1 Tax=Haladaptatus halobius TaxID=2884875 RepID=UPI0034A3D9E3